MSFLSHPIFKPRGIICPPSKRRDGSDVSPVSVLPSGCLEFCWTKKQCDTWPSLCDGTGPTYTVKYRLVISPIRAVPVFSICLMAQALSRYSCYLWRQIIDDALMHRASWIHVWKIFTASSAGLPWCFPRTTWWWRWIHGRRIADLRV